MTKRDFIKENKKELSKCINKAIGREENEKVSNEEIEMWLLNDESLYNWARSEGVRV